MYKITVQKYGQTYVGRFNTEQECISWFQTKHIDGGTYIIENVKSQFEVDKLWHAVNNWIETQFDLNCRHSVNLMLADPNISQEKYAKIVSYSQWWENCWTVYKQKKDLLLAGETITFDPAIDLGKCPISIWDLSIS